ncbi:hypothetical protein LBMAG53_13140 [Planctomycetota bacterium]|nr:hypothetical protein LBMAG53_13140 [Planctomycetota bacterium]
MAPIRSLLYLLPLSLAATLPAEDVVAPGAAIGVNRGAANAVGAKDSSPTQSTHSWELPPITVYGHPGTGLREEDRVGSYEQPRWTARRRFTEVRSYVIPEGQIEFEYWLIAKDFGKDKDDNGQTDNLVTQVFEVEMGLPYRFQFDLYQVWAKSESTGTTALDETKFEIRWAFADWGVIWANPTLYLEWAQASGGYDAIEGKLLFSDELAPHWHWAANLVYERKVGGDEATAYEFNPALSYTLIDERLSVGVEGKFAYEDVKGARRHYEKEILFGPNLQFRPAPQMHINASWLPEWTKGNALTSKTTLIVGWEF